MFNSSRSLSKKVLDVEINSVSFLDKLSTHLQKNYIYFITLQDI